MKLKVGKLYIVEFLDHSIGGNTDFSCKTVGWFVEEDEDFITLAHWDLVTEDEEWRKGNQEKTKIIKGTIKKISLIRTNK